MCYRCDGKERKGIETTEHFRIYRGDVEGLTWEMVEASEVTKCMKARLEEIPEVKDGMSDPARPKSRRKKKNGGI